MHVHFSLHLFQYPDAPNSWYIVTLAISVVISLVVIYKTNSTLPWYENSSQVGGASTITEQIFFLGGDS